MLVSRRGKLLSRVLSTIANAAIAMVRHPGNTSLSAYRTMREFEKLQDISDRQLRSISSYIVAKKYIRITKQGNAAEIALSESGKRIVARQALLALKPQKQKVWDLKWRIVIFDIPNQLKAARDGFAAMLKRLDFIHVQKSVFISPYPCEEELEVIADYFGVTDCVEIIIAERLMNERKYKSHFGLK
ncbi:MAG: hypothetical protein AAB899_04150 [Patescibacteria group bacterium]